VSFRPAGIASALRACASRRPIVLALAAGVIADDAKSLRSPGLRPVDCGTVPAFAGLLSRCGLHTPDATTAQGVTNVRYAFQPITRNRLGTLSVRHPRRWASNMRVLSSLCAAQSTDTGPLTVEIRTRVGPEPNSMRLRSSSHVLRPSEQTLALHWKGPWPSDSRITPDL
jgi:hypothetical protein